MIASTTQPVSWWQWTALGLISAAVIAAGAVVCHLVGFPYYAHEQGALIQQPLTLAATSLAAMCVTTIIAVAVVVLLTRPLDSRAGVAIGLLAIGGFSLPAGTMGSVMLASGGPEVFWLLAGEAAVLGLFAFALFALRKRVGIAGDTWEGTSGDRVAAIVQLVAFLVMMLILGRWYAKGQAIGAVFFAGLLSSVLTRLLIGRVWVHGWAAPLIGAVVGYLVNAVTASNVEVALNSGPAAGLAAALPLDYVAFGPAGVLLGELLHGHHRSEPETSPAT